MPLLGGVLVLMVIGAIATAAYLEVRRTTVLAAMARIQAVSQQMASLLRNSHTTSIAAIRDVGQKEDIREYLQTRDPRLKTRVLSSLRYTGTNSDQMLAVELRISRASGSWRGARLPPGQSRSPNPMSPARSAVATLPA